jgi:hypothetical protein
MKKIKSLQQLQSEKKKLQQQQEELENRMVYLWKEVKYSFTARQMAKETLQKLIQSYLSKNLSDQSLLKTTLVFGATILAKRLVNKRENKSVRLLSNQ